MYSIRYSNCATALGMAERDIDKRIVEIDNRLKIIEGLVKTLTTAAGTFSVPSLLVANRVIYP